MLLYVFKSAEDFSFMGLVSCEKVRSRLKFKFCNQRINEGFMKRLLFVLIVHFFSMTALGQLADGSDETLVKPLDYEARPFNDSDLKNILWMKEFKNIIVINKANEGSDKQTMRLYTDGKLKEFTRISTGRENYEKGCAPNQIPKRDHCSKHAYWSQTPVGYFDVDDLVENYFSNLWQTWMPYAVFFESGIATHQAPAGTESKLGGRASGGCVRLHPSAAPIIFNYVKNAGKGLIPKINRNGDVAKTAQGDIIREQGYKTLVIVQNVVK